jgi:DNA topoisomerase-1
VQSVALRLIVEREREIEAFVPEEYWNITAALRGKSAQSFTARLNKADGEKIEVKNAEQAARVKDALSGAKYKAVGVTQREQKRNAPAPYTTSKLQQDATSQLRFTTKRTMSIAQKLYEGIDLKKDGGLVGLITYMRTDSVRVSADAVAEVRTFIQSTYGERFLPAKPNVFKSRKDAQEAHEAIRPTDFRLAPSQLERTLDSDDLKVYELIWKRTMASQMVDARVLRTAVEIRAAGPAGEPAFLTASGKAIEFAGFRRAYVEGSDDPAAELEEQEAILPQMQVGDRIDHEGTGTAVVLLGTEPKRHETTPPARFTEASLIKELERLGIGRPSTFAPTIATIVRRGYVFRQGKALVPSFTAFAVTKLLREHFGDFVETDFTAEMEEDLDEISRGEREWVAFLKQFYYGDKKHRGLLGAVEQGAENADYPVLELGEEPDSGDSVRIRIGRFGPFVQLGDGGPGRTASLPEDVAPADLTVQRALELVRAKAEGPRTLGVDPATSQNVYVMNGRYGAYVQLGETPEGKKAEKPKRASLQSGMTEASITLDEALKLLSLPRVVGLHPDDNEPITTNFGRFGPYVKHNDEFRSLESEDDVFTISFDAALELLRAPKQSRRRQGAQKKTLRELTNDGTTLKLLAGRYGPYVTDGTTNASLPKAVAPESLTFEQAMELLAARRDAAPAPRRGATKRRAAGGTRTARGGRKPKAAVS